MTLTNFPNGISSFGIPVLGGASIPFTGKYFFVDVINGADGNDGSASSPMASLVTAYGLAVSGRNDVIFIIGNGLASGTQRLSEQLVWAKNATHLIGITAPTRVGQRARISHAATAPTTAFTPMVLVTGDGCLFANFSIYEGFNEATAVVTWEDQGERNYYYNVTFQGMGLDAKSADAAGSADLLLTGGGEHTFEHCTIGLDTVARGAANANVRIRTASARNTFENCTLLCSADAGTPIFIDTNAANSLNRWAMFKNCDFLNALNISPGATILTAAVAFSATQNGTVFINQCSKANTTDWTASDTGTVRLANMPTTSGDTGGEYVTSDAT